MYERILNEMKLKGIKYISDLARISGVTEGSIRMIKYGNKPSAERLLKIANVLGVSVNYLVTGEPDDDPFTDPTPQSVVEKQKKVLSLLDGLSEDNYKAAIDYLMYLKEKEDR